MVKHADLLICDSKNIESYIQNDYAKYQPQTTYIAYGTDTTKSRLTKVDDKVRTWYFEKGVIENNYYLVVGRFVPENNYEAMIRGFMASNSDKDFVLVTNVEENKFYDKLRQETGFDKDPRVESLSELFMTKNCSSTFVRMPLLISMVMRLVEPIHHFLRHLSQLSSISCWMLALTVKSVKMVLSIGKKTNWQVSLIKLNNWMKKLSQASIKNQVNVSKKPLLGKKLLQTTRKYLKDRNAENFISSRWCRNVWC